MAYTPINWQTGDTITAEKMNKMDNGWGVESTQLFSETVTTSDMGGYYGATLAYVATAEPPETLIINYDGTDYTCKRQSGYTYGASSPSFSDYPFAVVFNQSNTQLMAAIAGSHTISANVVAVEISDNFSMAAKSAVGVAPLLCVDGTTTYDEMNDALSESRMMYFVAGWSYYFVTEVYAEEVLFTPTTGNITATFVDDVFTVTYN